MPHNFIIILHYVNISVRVMLCYDIIIIITCKDRVFILRLNLEKLPK